MVRYVIEDSDLRELNSALQQLRINESRVTEIINRLQRADSNTEGAATGRRNHTTPARVEEEDTYPPDFTSKQRGTRIVPTSTLRYGDRVVIRNPNAGQQKKGIAVGTSKKRLYILVRTTPNRDIVKRIPANLKLVSNPNEWNDINP